MMPYIITDSIVYGKSFKLYDAGEMYRDWTYVGDIVSGVIAALERPLGYERLNLGRGQPVRMADFVELVERLVGRPAMMETPPAPASEPKVTYADVSRATALLGYQPSVTVEEECSASGDGIGSMSCPARSPQVVVPKVGYLCPRCW